MKKFICVWALLCLLLSLTACAAPPDDTTAPTTTAPAATVPTTIPATTAAPENLAPDFTVYDAEGNPVKLSDFRGKPVVLNFWASWCGPCKAEMPDLQQVYELYGQDVQFLIVNLTDGERETVSLASDYIAQQGYTFPVFYDTDYTAVIAYGITGIPATFFIDAQGRIVVHTSGKLSLFQMKQGISQILPEA